MNLPAWLKQHLDKFDLRVRGGRIKERGHDLYYCLGWADGYVAAQRDARKASRQP